MLQDFLTNVQATIGEIRALNTINQSMPGDTKYKVNAYFNCIQDYVTEAIGEVQLNAFDL